MVFVSVVALMVLSLVTAARGNDVNLNRFLSRSSGKRSDGLMRDLVNLLMEEKRERKDLSDENKAMKKAMNEMKQSLAVLTRTGSRRYTDILNQIAWIRNQTGTNGSLPPIGFTVRLGGAKTVSGIMVFKYIIGNYGARYNSTTGKFTCDKSGLYTINLSILSYSGNAEAHIMKNNVRLGVAFTSGGGSNSNLESGSVNAVVELDVGDQIWVISFRSYKYNPHSYFSGALISA